MLQKGVHARLQDPGRTIIDIQSIMRNGSNSEAAMMGESFMKVMQSRADVVFTMECQDFRPRRQDTVINAELTQVRRTYQIMMGRPRYPMQDKPIDITLAVGMTEEVTIREQAPISDPNDYITSMVLRYGGNTLRAASHLALRKTIVTKEGEAFPPIDDPYPVSIDTSGDLNWRNMESVVRVYNRCLPKDPYRASALINLATLLAQDIEYTASFSKNPMVN